MEFPTPSVFAVVSVLCSCLMYYNMRCSMDLKSLRNNLSSMFMSEESDKIVKELSKDENSLTLDLERTVQSIAKTSLSGLHEQLNKLREEERSLQSTIAENCLHVPIDEVLSQMSLERINYADEILGARIEKADAVPLEDECSFPCFGGNFKGNPPENILHSCMKPGSCYAFKHSIASVTISLAKVIYIEAIEIQHIPKYRSPTKETSSAPREFEVFGINLEKEEFHLGVFEFENLKPYQVFPLQTKIPFGKLRFDFLSNHGNPNFTCVYRVAVYGRV